MERIILLEEKEKPTIHLGVYGVLIRIYLHVSVDSIVQGALLRVPRNRFLRAMCYCKVCNISLRLPVPHVESLLKVLSINLGYWCHSFDFRASISRTTFGASGNISEPHAFSIRSIRFSTENSILSLARCLGRPGTIPVAIREMMLDRTTCVSIKAPWSRSVASRRTPRATSNCEKLGVCRDVRVVGSWGLVASVWSNPHLTMERCSEGSKSSRIG